MGTPVDELVELLDLEQIELNIFRGRSPEEALQRTFGGQVAGQALVAAGRTVDSDRPVHSLHAYFLRPGVPGVPIVYQVDRIRDGRSFTTRRVLAIQGGRSIFALTADFHVPEEGAIEHQHPMPEVAAPEDLPSALEEVGSRLGELPRSSAADSPSTSGTSTGCAGPRRSWPVSRRAAASGCAPTVPCPTTR